ncbi:unnamed protein product [Adineta ricciae]|uniref:C-type lectin domain-containing protein n=1 Tax=Adineta ricciae TaxID=249248 RepID=A0A814MAI3_ADIRI|nr:unnamed protein product [Adineta ricciae]
MYRCSDCPKHWEKFDEKKCFLFPTHSSSIVSWNEAQHICRSLIAQPLVISTRTEFIALQRHMKYTSHEDDPLTVAVHFHQGIWIQIDNKWTDSHLWCDKNVAHRFGDCVQVRWNSSTEMICLRYVSCTRRAQYICEVSSRTESYFDNSRRLRILSRRTKRLITEEHIRALPNKKPPKTPPKKPGASTPNKNPASSINNAGNILVSGINTAGHVANAVNNVFGGANNANNGNTNQNYNSQNDYTNNNLQALGSGNGDNNKSDTSWTTILFIGALVIGGIMFVFVVLFIVICLLRKSKTNSRNRRSAGSVESTLTTGTSE